MLEEVGVLEDSMSMRSKMIEALLVVIAVAVVGRVVFNLLDPLLPSLLLMVFIVSLLVFLVRKQ